VGICLAVRLVNQSARTGVLSLVVGTGVLSLVVGTEVLSLVVGTEVVPQALPERRAISAGCAPPTKR